MNDCASPSNGMALSKFGTAAVVALLCIPGTVLAQGALTNGENHSGAIATPGEIDEWTFTAALGDYILLSVGEVPPGEIDPDFRPWIRLRRPDGMEIGSDIGAIAAQINIEAPLTGTYTVLVRDSTVNRPGNVLGSYVLHFLKAPGTYTIPAGDEGGPLVVGGNTAGRIGAAGATPSLRPGDLDVWTFAAAQNDAIVLTIGEVLDSEIDPNFQPWIRLFGPNGDLLGSDLGTLAATLYVNPAPLSGTMNASVACCTPGTARTRSITCAYVWALASGSTDERRISTSTASTPSVLNPGSTVTRLRRLRANSTAPTISTIDSAT